MPAPTFKEDGTRSSRQLLAGVRQIIACPVMIAAGMNEWRQHAGSKHTPCQIEQMFAEPPAIHSGGSNPVKCLGRARRAVPSIASHRTAWMM